MCPDLPFFKKQQEYHPASLASNSGYISKKKKKDKISAVNVLECCAAMTTEPSTTGT